MLYLGRLSTEIIVKFDSFSAEKLLESATKMSTHGGRVCLLKSFSEPPITPEYKGIRRYKSVQKRQKKASKTARKRHQKIQKCPQAPERSVQNRQKAAEGVRKRLRKREGSVLKAAPMLAGTRSDLSVICRFDSFSGFCIEKLHHSRGKFTMFLSETSNGKDQQCDHRL